ncbi:MAG: Ig-like domain-containing protein [Lachnospiraceae bacterium]|nr:Ig-like domain-containing protein [Lachnospiraceae bacterium]
MEKRRNRKYGILVFICAVLFSVTFGDIDTARAASVKLNKKSANLWVGDALQLKVKKAKKKVKWSSNKKSVATVSSKGKVKAKKAGKAVITAKVGSKKLKCNVTVKKTQLSKTKITVNEGGSASLTLKNPKKKVTWSSDNSAIAYADGKKVYGRSVGNAVITAKCNGKSYRCNVTVLPKQQKAYLSATSLTIKYSEKAALSLINASKDVAWFSGDTRIAYIENGYVSARSVGQTTITAKCDGAFYVCQVTVVSGETEELTEDGTYTSKERVALYIHTYGKLPGNFITKEAAGDLGWTGGSLLPYAPFSCIGGNKYSNYEGTLPQETGRQYYECDINTLGALQRGAERLVYSNDGLIYYTPDHYETFVLLYE